MTNHIKYNYGIAILKIVLCFDVVLCHFSYGNFGGLQWGKNLAVPCFVIISFHFMKELIIEGSFGQLKHRVQRFLVPHLCWTIVYFIFNIFLFVVGIEVIIPREFLKDTLAQIIFGSTLNPPTWYHIDVIILVIFIFVLYKIMNNKRLFQIISVLIIVAALLLQYTGINYVTASILPFSAQITVGRLVEILPYTIIGLSIDKVINIEYSKAKIRIIGLIFILSVVVNCHIPMGKGFGYNGIGYIVSATLLVLFSAKCYRIIIFPEKIQKVIKELSALSMGVYFVHMLIGKLCSMMFVNFHTWNDLLRTAIVFFFLCYNVVSIKGSVSLCSAVY